MPRNRKYGFRMHNLALPLVGFCLAIAFVYLYKDLRKVKNWRVASNEPPLSVTDSGLEAIGYLDPCHPIGTTSEAPGCEAVGEVASAGLGDLVENVGHLLHH
jgi:hypothetical protein